jgi:hypothetical protein
MWVGLADSPPELAEPGDASSTFLPDWRENPGFGEHFFHSDGVGCRVSRLHRQQASVHSPRSKEAL